MALQLHKKIELSQNTPKPFPFSDDAEKYVLGALLVDSGAMVRVASELSSKHFYNERQAKIYAAIQDLFKKGDSIDILTVFQRCQLLHPKSNFNPLEIVQLSNKVASAKHIEGHAEIIRNKWAQREIMRIGNKMLYLASAPTQDIKEMLGDFGGELMQLNREAIPDKTETTADTIRKILDDIRKPTQGIKGITTGIPALDRLTEGLEKGDFVIIGGRPGMGKTAMLTSIGQSIAYDHNKPVVFISYEMTKERIYQRIISLRAGIDSRTLGRDAISKEDLVKVEKVANEIYSNPNFIFMNGRGLDVVGIRAKLMELKQTQGIEAVFIDYLQRIPILKSHSRKSTHDAIGANTKALAELALELNIPIVTPCQLGRKSTEGNPRPTLTALRDSGNIEDDAVKVWFIHRPEYYKIENFENGDPTRGKAEIIQAKSRNGELGETIINFHAPTTRFYSDEPQYFESFEPEEPEEPEEDDSFDCPF